MTSRAMSRNQVREIDRRAIEEYGLPGAVLMENAGRGCVDLLESLGIAGTVVICCGKGNNAGDGFVIARHLENRGYAIRVVLVCSPDQLAGDAAVNFGVIEKAGTPIHIVEESQQNAAAALHELLDDADWIVDALLGTGTRGRIREPFVTVIDTINNCHARVLAVDLPSGLDCDSGAPLERDGGSSVCCVRAEHTATFVARKTGFDNDASCAWTGQVHVIDIGVPRSLLT